jgi:hypothetical protein
MPLACAALAATILALLPAESRPLALHVLAEVVKLLALLGLGAGALVFDRTDYLRRGWGLLAVCYAFLLGRDAWLITTPGGASTGVEIGRGLLVVAANACAVAGAWTLARAWGVAGLEHPGSRAAQRVAIAVAVLASLLFAGPSFAVDLRDTFSGHPGYFWAVASDLGDLLALPVLAPVAMTALAVKDGSLRWPWGLLAASLAAWLLYDAVLTVPEVVAGLDVRSFRLAADCVRVFAATSACAAGLAQRRAIRELGA